MTGNTAKSRAQRRVSNTNTIAYDWDSFFEEITDEVFSFDEWKFNRQELNYIHSSSVFEKTFNSTATEKSLNKIITIHYTTSYTLIMGIPVPATNSSQELTFLPLQAFRTKYPDQLQNGQPKEYTILHENDGLSGMQIGIYPRPSKDAAVWIDGIFIPTYSVSSQGTTEIPILPKQFHRIYVHGMAFYAATQANQDKIAQQERKLFELVLKELQAYDNRNPKSRLRLRGIHEQFDNRRGPFFPENFPIAFTRR